MDFDDKNKKAEDIVNYFKETEQRKALCDEIANVGLDQTDFTQKYNIERLLIADVAVLEEVLAELKKQTKLQQEILNELKAETSPYFINFKKYCKEEMMIL